MRVFKAHRVPVYGNRPALDSFRLLQLENSGRSGVEDQPQRAAEFPY
jgi:hypothetical protein